MDCGEHLGELARRAPGETAVWAGAVVLPPPVLDEIACIGQAGEPLLAQALVPEAPVEGLDERVLDGLPRTDEEQLDPVPIRPRVEDAARELRAVVADDAHRQP